MTTRRPLTLGEGAWLIAPALFYVAMHVPIPGVDAEYLAEALHGGHSGLLKAVGVTTIVLFIVWGIGTGRIFWRRNLPKAQSL